MRFATASALAIALAVPFAAAATAQSYPSRTVTVVVPFPAGGSVDGVARIMVQKLNETMGQHFIVENRAGGASGIVGANAVAKAAPDGYTLLVSASVHVINPFLYKSGRARLHSGDALGGGAVDRQHHAERAGE
jgi:tripartite-type tricarboxylate transporter receptor subunit TctC